MGFVATLQVPSNASVQQVAELVTASCALAGMKWMDTGCDIFWGDGWLLLSLLGEFNTDLLLDNLPAGGVANLVQHPCL